MLDKVREDKMNINELLEPNAKKAVFTFGRFNPPTKGHARLMDVVKNAASGADHYVCLLYTSPSPRDDQTSRMPSSA